MEWWTAPAMWSGGECWIIGGGPSLPRVFGVPEALIQQVRTKEAPFTAYADYLSPLHGRNVIGTNIAYRLGPWVSVLYFCDKAFWLANKQCLSQFHNLKVTDVNNLPLREWFAHRVVKKMRRDDAAGLADDPEVIKWNRNSGGGAINLAAHFGVKRILLLGFDMKADPSDSKTQWHEGEVNYERPTKPYSFVRFLRHYPYIKRDAEARGIEILNVTEPGMSDLKEFKQVKLKEVL